MTPVFVGKLLLRNAPGVVSGHHLCRLLNTELGVRHMVSREFGISALGLHVIHVVLIGAEEQMVNPVAARVVTAMEHHHSVRDWSIVKFPLKSMDATEPGAVPHRAISHVASGRTCPHEAFTVPSSARGQMIRERRSGQALSCRRLKRSVTREASLMHGAQTGFASGAGSLCAGRSDAIHGNNYTPSEGP